MPTQTMITDTALTELPTRLRQAREDKGLSRAQAEKLTGIPAKSIEKFETDNQEPSISRVKTLCDVYEICPADLLGMDVVNDDEIDDDGFDHDDVPTVEAEEHNDDDVDTSIPSHRALVTIDDTEVLEPIIDLLNELGVLRDDGLESHRRRATRLIEELQEQLRSLEPVDLIKLADVCELYRADCPTANMIEVVFSESMDKGQAYCGKIEERIIDTAVFGIDLYEIERKPLVALAEKLAWSHGVEMKGTALLIFDDWGTHQDLALALRPTLRKMAIMGEGPDLVDSNKFKRRS